MRFATLHLQSYDYDELQTVHLLRESFGQMLSGIAGTESTPPLYYLLARAWSAVFGTAETGLRALSALLGTATVGVAYLAARELASRPAALFAALLTAVSPWLVWYSQEARAYALVTLLAAVSLLFFVRSLRRSTAANLWAWSAASALALASHYFAAFILLPEAIWLCARVRPLRRIAPALLALAAAGAALAPLALHQRSTGHGDQMIALSGSLALRVAQLPKQLLIGYDAPHKIVLAAVAAALVAGCGAVALARDGDRPAAALIPAALAATALAIPIALALAGLDYVVARNVIVVCVPAFVVVAIGVCSPVARRVGPVLGLLLVAVFAATTLAVATVGRYQRDDWRGAARSLGARGRARALIVTPPAPPTPFAVYLPGLTRLSVAGARVGEIDIVAIANVLGRAGQGRALPHPARVRPPAAGFREVGRTYGDTFVTVRFRSPAAVLVSPRSLARASLQPHVRGSVFLEPAASR